MIAFASSPGADASSLAAGVADPLVRADTAHCAAIVREHARTFSLASRFLPPEKRRGAFAVYAFARIADDIVDRAEHRERALVEAEFARYRTQVADALRGRPRGPVLRELLHCVRRFGIPVSLIDELLVGIGRDLLPVRYESWDELSRYCAGVASSVGSMCTFIFGVVGREKVRACALRRARALGLAMQLTNILRDVGEDAARGRCYLPHEDLSAFGLDPERVLRDAALKDDPRWRDLMRFEIARARGLYRSAGPGLLLLAPDARRCARACADGYAAILGAIERNGYDSFTSRARVGTLQRAGLLWSLLRSDPEEMAPWA